ncbi:hypothetical protein [Methylomonas koyamae]|uniref:hypothetical protein n=1 Tax=Methylomonas koyamae TaxID=702114 RepID=UPI000AE2D441|nr:hypothetical protein [Methylomonas koyamae]BBL57067.1 hypothetical protein MKFW12EY_06800 [Methylomonas koyamae]
MSQPNPNRRPDPADNRALTATPPAAAPICPAPAAAKDTDKDSSADKEVTLFGSQTLATVV